MTNSKDTTGECPCTCSKNKPELNEPSDSHEDDKRTVYVTLSALLLTLGFMELFQTMTTEVTGVRILNLILIALLLTATRFMAYKSATSQNSSNGSNND